MYAAAYTRAERLLGTERTFSSQLDRVGRQMYGSRWGGVHARDTLPAVARTGRRGMIVNTDLSTGSGVHWIAVLDEDGQRAMSDPLGKVGREQRRQLNAIEQPVWSEDDPEQHKSEDTCGPRSLAAIAVGLAHGMQEFLRV
eukprot:COSAG02_NODE_856_length_16468_cov_131.787831_3_plen_141_part_00